MAESSRETEPDAGLPLGFRGFAAGFQPEVSAFLCVHGPMLGGLTAIDDMDRFTSCISDMRPDYILVAGRDPTSDLIDRVQSAARTAHLGVLAVGEGGLTTGEAAPGLSIDKVARDMTGFDLALVLRALMRRARPQAMVGRAVWGDLDLDEARLTFSIRDRPVSLSLEVFSVLGLMMDAPARVWERETLHRLIFGAGSANDLRSVDTRISRARRHVAAALGADPILTVRGVGYALVAEP